MAPMLQALLWGYMDGLFKENDNPFKHYVDFVEFVKPIWGDMKGPRWEDFDTVADRVNKPELFDYWVSRTITYGRPRVGYTQPAKKTFYGKVGDCSDVARLGQVFLDRAGYKVGYTCIPNHVMAFIKEAEKYRVIIDWGRSSINRMHPPRESLPGSICFYPDFRL